MKDAANDHESCQGLSQPDAVIDKLGWAIPSPDKFRLAPVEIIVSKYGADHKIKSVGSGGKV
ncbi:hypothetical protein QFC19_008952 [Naganishia cerealis]|uniref:Uncharacterized protein n=1 Tax=Naganishia cerealis TaxID=610337 RepID=A0ACC2UZE6_9TREE|nr:hypothetical protein QFC19_008952 [Naganishia cerealis]